MTKDKETINVIDLGAATVETKGVSTIFPPDEQDQQKPHLGLSAD